MTPATSDGDPSEEDEVIEKAAIAIDGVMVNNMPEDNAQWHDMVDKIHAMAEQAAQAEEGRWTYETNEIMQENAPDRWC